MTHPIPKPSNHTKEAGMNTQEKLAALAKRMKDVSEALAETGSMSCDWASDWADELTTLLSEHGGGGEAGDESIMCEVAVAPATRFSPGVALSTVVDAIKSRRGTERYTFNAKMDRITTPPTPSTPVVDDAMVSRFLAWRLPGDFAPDGGISFTHITDPAWTHDTWPTGTNLFHAGQARAMLEHCLAGAALSGVSAPVGVEDELNRFESNLQRATADGADASWLAMFAGDAIRRIRAARYSAAIDPSWEVLLEHSGCGYGKQVDQITVGVERGDKVVLIPAAAFRSALTPPAAAPRVENDASAKKLYDRYTDNHPTIHCNRFPAWSELSESSKQEWRNKAASGEGEQA